MIKFLFHFFIKTNLKFVYFVEKLFSNINLINYQQFKNLMNFMIIYFQY